MDSKKGGSLEKSRQKASDEDELNRAVLNNLISLQKVMVNLALKIDSLSTQMSKLLELFEISARSLAKKDFGYDMDNESKKILQKLDAISQQAGLIGKGLALIYEMNQNPNKESVSPMPKKTSFMNSNKTNMPDLDGYQESIARDFDEEKEIRN